jgi:antitoxin (DNA-binding transcriptional repressor) of toxin-antitoxin stability system
MINIMKWSSKKPATCDSISTHQMRFEFERVLRAVKAGRSLTLPYRNKPLNEELPVPENDPIFRFDQLSEPIGRLTNGEIDRLVYGE